MPTKGDFLNNNRYEILRVLSDEGGMGVVYLATDFSFNDTVVIKHSRFTEQFIKQQYPTLPPDQMRQLAERLRKAFAREARLLRGLNHPALPRVIDYFTVGDEQQFFVMDFIAGQDFNELLKECKQRQEAPFAWAEVRDWADQLLDALDYLHTHFAEPIIHRDIKPGNLKLKPDGKIVLLDFGLAKGAAGEMSVVGSVLSGAGTPQYAPLEQMHREGTDARSDLYSLAVTLHHLLTGHEPPTAVVRASETISHRPDPLHLAHELNPQIPAAVSEVLQRAAALDPDSRPATAAEMREALRRASQPEPAPNPAQPPGESSEPTTVDPPSAPSTPPDIAPRRRRWKYAAAGVVLALAIGLATLLSRNSSTPANASFEAKPLNLAPTPTSTVAESPPLPASLPGSWLPFTEDLGNGVTLEMLAIYGGGTFEMGSDEQANERPKHRVKVATTFAIGKYEVTQAQWKAVMGNNPSSNKSEEGFPVVNVSWNDAQEFCRTLSEKTGKIYRLPTEAEWEYACRAGSTSKFSFGDDDSKLPEYAWSLGRGHTQMHPVGQLKSNAFGLYDMHGSVWEWCQDVWHNDYNGAPTDSSAAWGGGDQSRVMRGGSWLDGGLYCRSAARLFKAPDKFAINVGFRVCVAKTR